MMAVAVQNFWSRFLIIRQNVNMATIAILNCGLTPQTGRNWLASVSAETDLRIQFDQ